MSVSGGRQHRRTGDSIIWSPHKATQRLFLCSSESQLKLFEWTGQDYQPDNATVNQVKAVAIHTSASIIKSVSWCQATDLSTIVATGNAVGKVSLMNLASFAVINGSLLISNAAKSLINKKERKSLDVDVLHSYQSLLDNHSNMPICSDYIPTNSRSCNTVAFSITNPHLLLAGFDKVRVDSCIYVWDICRPQIDASRQNTMSVEYTSSLNLPSLHKPISQYGTSEGVTSMCWMNEHAARFVAGMSLRYIRSYDCRDPFSTNRFASFGDDGVIRIWDERKLTDPIYCLIQIFARFWQIHDVFKDKSTGTLVPTFTPKDNVASQLASTDWGNIPPTLSRTEPLGTGQTAAVPTSGLPSRGNDWGMYLKSRQILLSAFHFCGKCKLYDRAMRVYLYFPGFRINVDRFYMSRRVAMKEYLKSPSFQHFLNPLFLLAVKSQSRAILLLAYGVLIWTYVLK
ncbi:hypothetical protein BASA81_018194 [Batrachochytrium salamandrivorans]|nr:hypothetical protein BASA81_018194 [Batrachochytrium salamandrivorans]